MAKKTIKADSTKVTIPVKWKSIDELPTLYANQLFLTHASGEFYLIFGEVNPKFFLESDELPKYVEAIPKAKIAVLPENMEKFLQAIQTNLEKYKELNKRKPMSNNRKKDRRGEEK